eukprot:352965-Chlamydomonas_euryale.AAC.36
MPSKRCMTGRRLSADLPRYCMTGCPASTASLASRRSILRSTSSSNALSFWSNACRERAPSWPGKMTYK